MPEFSYWAEETGLGASMLSSIGGFSSATVGDFAVNTKEYKYIPDEDQVGL